MTLKALFISGLVLASATMAQAADHVVTITGFAFQPAALTVAVGDRVTFINKDGAPHTATQTGGTFDTGQLSRNAQGTVTLAKAGAYDYFCAVHPMMKGRITVK